MPNHFVAFWNLENLFAPEGFASREPWLAQRLASDLNGWTQALFDTKIDQLASIIRQMNGAQGPDILGVCEVENAFVLQQLTARLNGQINTRNYAVAHVDSTQDRRGIDTAFVFDSPKYTVDPNAIFSHFVMRRTGIMTKLRAGQVQAGLLPVFITQGHTILDGALSQRHKKSGILLRRR